MALPLPPLRTARCGVSRQRRDAAARRVAAALAVLVVALPSSASAGAAAAASPPPPADMGLLVARMERVEAAVREQARETREARADARALERRVAELEAERRGEEQREEANREGEAQQSAEPHRHLQARPTHGDVVHIHRANVSLPAGPGWNTSPNYNGGHRRSLQSSAQCGSMAARAQSVQARCCDEPTEDCSGGYPRTCNVGCAAVFLPFWAECGSLLGNAAVYQQTMTLCQQAQPTTLAISGGLAHEFNLVCADTTVGSCVPACSQALRGDLLMMNLNGEDSKYSCELHHGLHSWVGAATDGGYLGSDARAFVSAVLSGAAGYYALALTGDAGVGVDLTIRPGQGVRIVGDRSSATSWGSGDFTVGERGSISLIYLTLTGRLSLLAGGTASLSNCTLERDADIILASGGSGGMVSFATMAVPARVLRVMQNALIANYMCRTIALRLYSITVPELGPNSGVATSTSRIAGGSLSFNPPNLFGGVFVVTSGPCELLHAGRCVGRPHGYLPNEHCAITVGGGGGMLGSCGVFQLDYVGNWHDGDILMLPGGAWYVSRSCPVGHLLAPNDALTWTSSSSWQGCPYSPGHDCSGSETGLGGGWQICFA
jgi:hypothetical protein